MPYAASCFYDIPAYIDLSSSAKVSSRFDAQPGVSRRRLNRLRYAHDRTLHELRDVDRLLMQATSFRFETKCAAPSGVGFEPAEPLVRALRNRRKLVPFHHLFTAFRTGAWRESRI